MNAGSREPAGRSPIPAGGLIPELVQSSREFAHAVETLYRTVKKWPAVPPTTRGEVDAAAIQAEGLRHSLIAMRASLAK